jgi:hypothetical protein
MAAQPNGEVIDVRHARRRSSTRACACRLLDGEPSPSRIDAPSASQQVFASTEESSAATQPIAASASDLTEAAGRLEQMVAQFSLSPSA